MASVAEAPVARAACEAMGPAEAVPDAVAGWARVVAVTARAVATAETAVATGARAW